MEPGASGQVSSAVSHSRESELQRGDPGRESQPIPTGLNILCSFQFARSKEPYLRQTPWTLVVIDEAHRLRNLYKPTSKIASAIKQAIAPFPKVLLTATPLQNSLLELGLVSIIDDYAFGDLKSYRSRYTRLGNEVDFPDLKERPHAALQTHLTMASP